jgi:biofilm PGA synthesis protein PgaA
MISFLLVAITSFLLFTVPVMAGETSLSIEDKGAAQGASSVEYHDILEKARRLTREGKNKEALDSLSPYISEPGKYPVAASDYISILVWEGRFDEAVRMYKGLSSSFPRRAYLLRNIATAYYEKKNFLSAFSLFKKLLEQTPQDEEVQKGVVYALMQMGAYKNADDYLEKFLTAAPGSVQLLLIKAQLLSLQNSYMEALKIYSILAQRSGVDREFVYRSKENVMAALAEEKRHALAAALSKSVQAGEKDAVADYVLILIINKEYETALRVFEAQGAQIDDYPENSQSWISWAYFKTGNTSRAKQLYQKILAEKPDYARAEIGLAYCLAQEGRHDEAIDILDKLQSSDTRNTEIMYARAFVFEKSQRFWRAVEEYERILMISPNNPTAGKLMLMALSDLGARTQAFEEADSFVPDDMAFREKMLGDMAVDRIRWKEYRMAISILSPLTMDNENLRAKYDYITALTGDEDMKEAVEAYQELIKAGILPPAWIKEDIAGAYLYLEQPREALKLYDDALRTNPSSIKGRLGRFFALQELRKWDEARKALDDLDRDVPDVIKDGAKTQPNWTKFDIMLARGWFLLYEEKYEAAEEYFQSLYEKAPANAGFRAGLAHVYLWRGWPRKAVTEFGIAETLDPQDVGTQTGKIATLNTLAYREEARKEAGNLLSLHPKDKHVQDLVRRLKIEEMPEFATDFAISSDDDGFAGTQVEARLTVPVSLYTRIYGFLFWQKSEDNEDASVFRRTGLGADHVFSSSWHARQQFSVNYDDGKDFGSLSRIDFTPDDYWTFGLSYDSFTTDVPLRARVSGIQSDKLDADITYRESEWRSYRLSLSRMKFSDDNTRYQGLLGYEQGLLVKNDWKMRLSLEFFTSANSLDDAPYFNPQHDLSFSATHMTEQTLWRMYDRSFVQRLYLTLGAYTQSGFSTYPTASVRYEHDINFSDTNSLLYGVDVARHIYDGDAVTGYGFNLIWRLLL